MCLCVMCAFAFKSAANSVLKCMLPRSSCQNSVANMPAWYSTSGVDSARHTRVRTSHRWGARAGQVRNSSATRPEPAQNVRPAAQLLVGHIPVSLPVPAIRQSRQTTLLSTSVRVRTVVTTKQFILAVIYFSSAYCPDPLHSPKFYIYIAGDNIYQPLHNFTDNTYCQVSAENINSILLRCYGHSFMISPIFINILKKLNVFTYITEEVR